MRRQQERHINHPPRFRVQQHLEHQFPPDQSSEHVQLQQDSRQLNFQQTAQPNIQIATDPQIPQQRQMDSQWHGHQEFNQGLQLNEQHIRPARSFEPHITQPYRQQHPNTDHNWHQDNYQHITQGSQFGQNRPQNPSFSPLPRLCIPPRLPPPIPIVPNPRFNRPRFENLQQPPNILDPSQTRLDSNESIYPEEKFGQSSQAIPIQHKHYPHQQLDFNLTRPPRHMGPFEHKPPSNTMSEGFQNGQQLNRYPPPPIPPHFPLNRPQRPQMFQPENIGLTSSAQNQLMLSQVPPKSLSHMTLNLKNEQIPSSTRHTDIETADKIWLNNWLKFKPHKAGKELTSEILLPEAKSLVKGTLTMLRELKSTLKQIKETENEDQIQEKLQRAEEIKVSLDEMKKVIGTAEAQDMLKKKSEIARKKRERLKRKRKQKYEEKVAAMEKRKQLHNVIDIWQEEIANKVQEEKRDKELKTIADKTLAEVRHKYTDAKKSLDLLQSLRKLRSVRKDSKERKGLYTSKESDYMFEARLRMASETLEKQLQTYEAEKNMIQVMLDTEKEECKEYEQEELQRGKEEKEKLLEENIKGGLFGKEVLLGPPAPTHPMFRFYMYYDAANHSVENLCAIRHEWDQFLVGDFSQEGSSIPETWVTPSKPSSDTWASVLSS